MAQLIRTFRVRLIQRRAHNALLPAYRLGQRRLLLLLLLRTSAHPALDLRRARTPTGHHLVFDSVPAGWYSRISHRPVDLCRDTVCDIGRDAGIPHRAVYFCDGRRERGFVVALPLVWLARPRGEEAGVCGAEAWVVGAG